jgi:intracellular septation protein A
MGDRMVRPAGTPPAPGSLNDLPAPTWRSLFRRGLPQFGVESLVPVLVFYGVWKAVGLGGAVVCATLLSLSIAAWQIHARRGGALAVVTAVFVTIQGIVGLAAHSATVYLAQPVVLSALWGLAYVGSVAVGRPLIGVFANAWYPFPAWFRASEPYRREFGLQSLVWAAYCLGRAALRLYVLLHAGVGGFLLVSAVTGTPVLAALVLWGLWHARRTFGRLDDDDMSLVLNQPLT